ncbi:MAG TPA: alpha-L-fucosidase [Vicinamibacterales bacterium]|jgi:alpha-L-fucosidase|nr:alpha-L-fucosidase [Vicinamibacterales bacterium]
MRPPTAAGVLAILAAAGCLASADRRTAAPAALAAIPTQAQLAWHDLELYGFLHFTVNTFTDKEWGYGDEPETVFNPAGLDARQWAQVARDAGMKGLIITAKHHDGFCLWPSRFTDHSVKRSPWKNGSGDVVGELARACREYGLRFGVYLSPWDRNHAEYGRPAYLDYYRKQLRELLTNYGPVFEVWFDGANGGDGYYGGARERRTIDGATYYDWPNTWRLVRDLRPGALMFSDAGPDIRWVGNEKGVAFDTSWNPIDLAGLYPGDPRYPKIAAGAPDGHEWAPPEVDVSIRPGWFYHAAEDDKVASVDRLVQIYEQSVGRGANLLLNMPPDRRGLIPETDAARLRQFGREIADTYKTDLARQATARASTVRGNADQFNASRVNDGKPGTYWATDDGVTKGSVELVWRRPVRFDRLVLQEAIELGQRVEAWTIETESNGAWEEVARGTTVGHKRIARFAPVTASRARVTIAKARACPAISTIAVYLAPGR